MSQGPISYKPTDGLSYDPSEPVYWDRSALAKEVTRAFEICHGCRMCFKYCDAFPTLFELLDKKHDGDVTRLDAAETNRVMDACFQCKLCEVQCPYTPRDKHEFQLDFPKLVHRHQAIRAREEGTSLGDKFLGDPDLTGKLARASLGVVNTLNQVKLHRWFMEKVLGIHRDKLLPEFAPQGFEQWADQSGKIAAEPGGEAVLFQTCYVEHNEPQIGKDTCEVMERNGVDLRCASGLRCCGMPAWEHGDLASLRKNARQNLDVLMPFVERGAKVLAINPTCSMMLRREYPHLLEGTDRERAAGLAAAVMDPSEFLWSIRREPRFAGKFESSPHGQIAYHAPCHLRAQAVGFKGRDLIKRLPGVQVTTVTECCGHDGTYAMRVEGFEPSQRIGKKAFDGMRGAEATTWVTDCPLAAIQFEQHAGTRPLHPMSLLARAYRGDSFGPGETDETKEE
ncbi:glycerol 3-phosphate dehydrogenase (quinone) subunit C [Nannocystis exedens]|uniref:Glycerol 3-phosphate dehydrogenase (Quinone) subunit C n=1 Tax=Nannocystis exedens TaxID=54 RepID=A0A1I1Y461_9BACT|nr:heterodisulfide reductase-related iron-sulfur binding cluster [Nannocystis exedens]PCC71731.1 Anaerobic glycerol-3-phosphate dehydrogenase subunit C [Nannocystis exedens]SFE12883.1 glycerol 3-phosphate dehydrogenase (quinone) subunit C [Nannocystis exedens]